MYTGLTGKVKIGKGSATEIAYISNWSVEDTVELIEISELGKRTKDKVAGMRGWSGSADGAIEFGGERGHKALFDAMHNGDKVVCEFYLNDTTRFTGTGMIESLSIDLSAEDKGNISISISGTDELVYPGSAPVYTPPQQ
jgi:predicted secreted protein